MDEIIQRGLILFNKYQDLLFEYEIDTDLRQAHFLSQIAYESQFIPLQENVRISPQINKKSSNHINTPPIGNNALNGVNFNRSRGFIPIVGKFNYSALSNYTKIDYLNNPDLLSNEKDAMLSACWYWLGYRCNGGADADNVKLVTQKIDAGLSGLDERKKLLELFKTAIQNEKNIKTPIGKINKNGI